MSEFQNELQAVIEIIVNIPNELDRVLLSLLEAQMEPAATIIEQAAQNLSVAVAALEQLSIKYELPN